MRVRLRAILDANVVVVAARECLSELQEGAIARNEGHPTTQNLGGRPKTAHTFEALRGGAGEARRCTCGINFALLEPAVDLDIGGVAAVACAESVPSRRDSTTQVNRRLI